MQATSADDENLVKKVLDGESAAYAGLYDRYARLVRAICFDATRDLGQAQDLSQEVFLRAYQKLGGLRDPAKFGSWLVSIARRACQEWLRRHRRDRHRYVGVVPEDRADRQAPSNNGHLERLHQAMLLLPTRERQALYAFYLLDKSPLEARLALGLSRSGLYRVLERGRKRLKRLMGEPREVLL